MTPHCRTCGQRLNQPHPTASIDCGGDCMGCMAVVFNDPDCAAALAPLPLDRHPHNNTDRTSVLVSPLGAVGWEVFRLTAGYLACLPDATALPGLFPTYDAAKAAQVQAWAPLKGPLP